MKTKPGEVYQVDLGMGGKFRMMMVVSREDAAAPRAFQVAFAVVIQPLAFAPQIQPVVQ